MSTSRNYNICLQNVVNLNYKAAENENTQVKYKYLKRVFKCSTWVNALSTTGLVEMFILLVFCLYACVFFICSALSSLGHCTSNKDHNGIFLINTCSKPESKLAHWSVRQLMFFSHSVLLHTCCIHLYTFTTLLFPQRQRKEMFFIHIAVSTLDKIGLSVCWRHFSSFFFAFRFTKHINC